MSVQKVVTLLPGDGIGPEVMDATVRVLTHVVPGLMYDEHPFGETTGDSLPADVMRSILNNRFAIKGPTATPLGGGHSSLNVALRKAFDLYANVRPLVTMPNVRTRYNDTVLDIVIIRENSEGEYAITEQGTDVGYTGEFIFTKVGCRRIAEFAFRYARQNGRKKVHVGHKANILKRTHGLFRDSAYAVARAYPDIECRDLIIDNFAMQVVRNPSQFDVMLFPNLLGDIMSDLCAGIVHGSLGCAGSINIGEGFAVAEAVHGTAPDIVGMGVANPTALMLSAALLLERMNMGTESLRMTNAIMSTYGAGILTKDIDRANGLGTVAWTDEVIKRL